MRTNHGIIIKYASFLLSALVAFDLCTGSQIHFVLHRYMYNKTCVCHSKIDMTTGSLMKVEVLRIAPPGTWNPKIQSFLEWPFYTDFTVCIDIKKRKKRNNTGLFVKKTAVLITLSIESTFDLLTWSAFLTITYTITRSLEVMLALKHDYVTEFGISILTNLTRIDVHRFTKECYNYASTSLAKA